MSDEEKDNLLEAGEAAEYLAARWGIPHYSTDNFKKLRIRQGLKPTIRGKKTTLWSKAELDKIPRPSRGRRRIKKNETKDDPLAMAV